jgi:hypothetical protein
MPGTNGPEGLGEWVRPGESHNQQCAKVSLVRAGQAALTLALALRIYYFNLKYLLWLAHTYLDEVDHWCVTGSGCATCVQLSLIVTVTMRDSRDGHCVYAAALVMQLEQFPSPQSMPRPAVIVQFAGIG